MAAIGDVAGTARVDDLVGAWADSGAMALTGRADGPALGPPTALVPGLRSAAATVARRSAELGRAVALDPLQLLGERAAVAGLGRRGTTSCGGASRLLPAADGWVAVTLARPDDVDLVPAWLGLDGPPGDPWSAVRAAVAGRRRHELLDRAHLLGLPVASLPPLPAPSATSPAAGPPALRPGRAERVGGAEPVRSLLGLVVVDLSALWAGPLTGAILADAGATVVKVESSRRPDGARRGPSAFFDLLNAGKRAVALDVATAEGRRWLRRLVGRADVVVEASRPRALAQLGLDARALLAAGRPRVWVSITGHGRRGPAGERVGFGDDAAVAGGLVAWEDGAPRFCGDAVADPATGLVAAAACLEALATGGTWLLDLALADVAAHLAGPTLPISAGLVARPPRARPSRGSAPALGADTAAVLAGLGVPS